MDICGPQMRLRWRGANRKRRGDHSKCKRFMSQYRLLGIIWILLVPVLAGCAPTIKYGVPPKVKQLEGLKPGVSAKSDVLTAFGNPRGHGAINFHPLPEPREIWFYDYMETDGVRTDLKFLMVFFDPDRYDGHLWFSSSTLMGTGE